MLEIIQQRNKWSRNCLQINLLWFGNKKDSDRKREVPKPPSDTKRVWGEEGEGSQPTSVKIEFGHFMNEVI